MTDHKKIIFFVVVTFCCGLAHGGPFRGVRAPESFDVSELMRVQEQKQSAQREVSNPLITILDEITPRQGPYQEWLISLSKILRDLLTQLSGFAPYIAKLATPVIKTVSLVLEKGKSYVVDYIRNLPPETAQNIQLTIIELFKKLINMNLVKALIRLFLQALV